MEVGSRNKVGIEPIVNKNVLLYPLEKELVSAERDLLDVLTIQEPVMKLIDSYKFRKGLLGSQYSGLWIEPWPTRADQSMMTFFMVHDIAEMMPNSCYGIFMDKGGFSVMEPIDIEHPIDPRHLKDKNFRKRYITLEADPQEKGFIYRVDHFEPHHIGGYWLKEDEPDKSGAFDLQRIVRTNDLAFRSVADNMYRENLRRL